MSGYIGPSPVPQSIQRRQSFTATAGQTTFGTTGYTDGDFIDVYLNGVKLVGGTDYTATNGSDIVLTTGASASDLLDFVTFNSLSLANHTFDDSITLQNATEEDTDGGRETTIIFKGEQSGGEISTLAEIEASHDGTADDEKGDLIFRTNDGSDGSSPTERARFDSAGNLLVGTTSTAIQLSSSLEGFSYANGFIASARSGGATAYFNRQTSDGDIAVFRKDGTTVGSIGIKDFGGGLGSRLLIGEGDTALGFQVHVDNSITPIKTDGGTRDNVLNLGAASHRFKDLYLSGGVYVGGTGSANKLDDYEEGTWNVLEKNGQGGTMTTNRAHYTKIGNMVYAAASVTVGTTTNTNHLNFTLPFASSINGYYLGGGSVGYHTLPTAQQDNLRPNIENAADNVFFFYNKTDIVTCAQSSGKRIDFIVTYHTHA